MEKGFSHRSCMKQPSLVVFKFELTANTDAGAYYCCYCYAVTNTNGYNGGYDQVVAGNCYIRNSPAQ